VSSTSDLVAALRRATEAEAKLRHIREIHFLIPYTDDGPDSDGFCPQCDVKWPCLTAEICRS
jgi:hypothetical protein